MSSANVDQLLDRCAGQEVKIPFLPSLFPAWQARFNSTYDPDIVDELDRFQKRWIEGPAALKRNCGIDSIYFARSVFPKARAEDLKTAVVWISWLYSWDDALDFGELDNRPDEMHRYEHETIRSIEHTLLDQDAINTDAAFFAPTCRAAQAWYEIGIRIRKGVTSVSSRQFMYDCLKDYISASIELQKRCDRSEIPDIDSYLAIRMDTSAVYPTISMYLLTFQADPPAWFLSHQLVKEALFQMNMIISMYNDIVSARHEIKAGHIDNIIPLLVYHKELSAQEAVDEAVNMMKISYEAFRSVEVQLVELGHEHGISQDVSSFIEACVDLCMGAIQWTYHIKRYFDYTPGCGAVEMAVVLGQ